MKLVKGRQQRRISYEASLWKYVLNGFMMSFVVKKKNDKKKFAAYIILMLRIVAYGGANDVSHGIVKFSIKFFGQFLSFIANFEATHSLEMPKKRPNKQPKG